MYVITTALHILDMCGKNVFIYGRRQEFYFGLEYFYIRTAIFVYVGRGDTRHTFFCARYHEIVMFLWFLPLYTCIPVVARIKRGRKGTTQFPVVAMHKEKLHE